MGFFRWMFGLPLAAAVTGALFLAMALLIRQPMTIDEPGPDRQIQITTTKEPTTPRPERRPRIPTDPPPAPVIDRESRRHPGPVVAPKPEPGPIEHETARGSAVKPIFRFPPQYPEQCRARGAEGVVIVIFDITDSGDVVNARVLSSTNSCFDRTAVKTVLGWKYPAQARRGVTETFAFRLRDG